MFCYEMKHLHNPIYYLALFNAGILCHPYGVEITVYAPFYNHATPYGVEIGYEPRLRGDMFIEQSRSFVFALIPKLDTETLVAA